MTADESYYIEHAEQMRPKDEVDLSRDPPPDLVIEIETTTSAIAKLKLFAAMGVPEVWRYKSGTLEMFRLAGSSYGGVDSSKSLPGLAASTINEFLSRRFDVGETTLIREFRRQAQ